MENILDRCIQGAYIFSRVIVSVFRLYRDTGDLYKFLIDTAHEVSGGVYEDDEL